MEERGEMSCPSSPLLESKWSRGRQSGRWSIFSHHLSNTWWRKRVTMVVASLRRLPPFRDVPLLLFSKEDVPQSRSRIRRKRGSFPGWYIMCSTVTPKRICVCLNPKDLSLTSFWKRVFADSIKFMISRGDHPGFSEGTLNPMTKVPIRNGREDVQTRRLCEDRGRNSGSSHSQRNERSGSPEAGSGEERVSPAAFRRHKAHSHLGFRLVCLKDCERIHSCCLKVTRIVVIYSGSNRKRIQIARMYFGEAEWQISWALVVKRPD